MKKVLAAFIGLGFTCAPALAADPKIQVCASWKSGKAAQCLNGEKPQTVKGRTLFAITEQESGAFGHRWNGLPAEKMQKLNGGKTIVSSFSGGDGEGRTVTFAVTKGDKVVKKRVFDVRWQMGKMVAQEVDPSKPQLPEAVVDPEAPVASSTPTVTEAPMAAQNGSVSAFNWRRGEIHFAFLNRNSGKDSFTFVPYWNPEFRFPSWLGIGLRTGVTFWESGQGETFFAFEGDIHLSIPVTIGMNQISLQPAAGVHWWSAQCLRFSPGLVVDWIRPEWPISVMASFHAWKQAGADQRFVSIGVGKQF